MEYSYDQAECLCDILDDYNDFNDVHMDVFREIGNIGAGNAATSLSVMLNQPVDISLPKVNLLEPSEAAAIMGGEDTLSYGILLDLSGDVNGMIMFVLDKHFAHMMLNVLMGGKYESFDDLDEVAFSAIQEVGNILSGAYVNSLAELTGLRIEMSVPFVSIDTVGMLLQVPLTSFGTVGDKVLFIEESFSSNKEKVLSHMVLFAEMESLNLILGKLGLV